MNVSDSHALTTEEVLRRLGVSEHGLSRAEAAARLARFGPNTLPHDEPPGVFRVFTRQFLSPLIYILLLAAFVSMFLREWSDAGFIFGVLLINAIIGTAQEYSAQRTATALQNLVSTRAEVLREGDAREIDAGEVVLGDIVLLEAGSKIPADIRLLHSQGFQVDESLLTGESLPVFKNPVGVLAPDIPRGDRMNMAFSGSIATRGRARGVVVATGAATAIGEIATSVLSGQAAKPPLLLRMEKFTIWIAVMVGGAVLVMAAVAIAQGATLGGIFLLAVALAVSAIPEGLPVALTVALAIGMRRMARRNVIVRRLVAVESLGSCTFIASDKTGTLTVNELTCRRLAFQGEGDWQVTGEGTVPEGGILPPVDRSGEIEHQLVERLCRAVVLGNEGFLARRDGGWVQHGDAVDVALLVMAHKIGISRPDLLAEYPETASIPYEPDLGFAANLYEHQGRKLVFVKGALERLIPMCTRMSTPKGDVALEQEAIEARAVELSGRGYRVLAVADGELDLGQGEVFSAEHLGGLTLIGLVAMIDPLRPEAGVAVERCRRAGIQVCMVTGDHPETAFAIARELGLVVDRSQVVTGPRLRALEAEGEAVFDAVVTEARVFARVEPQQKLDLVRSLERSGQFVAVTGDGANDAPALKAAHVGVAMGKKGTDVARESAELIVTDDDFSSIVNGIEEGRVAYANVRKVIFLLISTGAAELVVFTLALFAGLPIPLLPVQLLWLNLVTNGIQDVALAFEPAEGGELERPPRPPREPIFNRLMVERVVVSALVMGVVAFVIFQDLLARGVELEAARNSTLLLMVLFENLHAFNSRSETRSVFGHNPMRNPLLLFGTVIAQLLHIGAMSAPGLSHVLNVQPIGLAEWFHLLAWAGILVFAMEIHKLTWRWRN